jgi:hypothetical protein
MNTIRNFFERIWLGIEPGIFWFCVYFLVTVLLLPQKYVEHKWTSYTKNNCFTSFLDKVFKSSRAANERFVKQKNFFWVHQKQGDQIGRIFAYRAIVYFG